MGGKGGGSTATNDQMVQMQMQQANQAREQNLERNARLQTGVQQIDEIFGGHNKGATLLDMSKVGFGSPYQYGGWEFNSAGQAVPVTQDPSSGSQGYYEQVMPDSGGAPQYGLYDPSGNLVTTGSSPADLANAQVWVGGDPSQKEGGIPQSFYDDYYNSLANQGLQDESQQYSKARSTLAFQLARAGTDKSTWGAQDISDLAQQDAVAQARVRAQASTQEGALRTTEAQNQQSALNQLYSTEDPTVAASTAENMVANADLQKTDFSPLGALFTPFVVGVGNAMSGFTNASAYINPGAGSTYASTPGTGGNPSGTIQA